MASLKAEPDIIVVDEDDGETYGNAEIKYQKEPYQELWERTPGSGWEQINVHVRTKVGDEADTAGRYEITLKPGEVYEVGIYDDDYGPLKGNPHPRANLKVYCLWKKPKVRSLITDRNQDTGGTWHWHQVGTNVPTNIVAIGVSQKPPTLDSNGIPRLIDVEGGPAALLGLTTNHSVEILPLSPGNHYFFVAVVSDVFGNWDVLEVEFVTLRRKLTIEFATLHIYNDGDGSSVGEGEFWFGVYEGEQIVKEFYLPTHDIDDWSESDRPYPVGFAHIGVPTVVQTGQAGVRVDSHGIEHDGLFENNEAAGFLPVFVPIPSGRYVETVTNEVFRMDCPIATVDDDFHYGVDVRWSVEYKP
ncbi:MAG TPA: hypothetical protein VGB73_08550 [Pyrinomonadaceae bacterium]|jgi:hypothetical protein